MREVLPILDFDDSSYDPFAMDETAFGGIEDIHSPLRKLIQQAPVHAGDPYELLTGKGLTIFGDRPQFTALSFEESMAVATDAATFSQDSHKPLVGQTFGRTLTLLNPPEHTQVRKLFQKAFLPKTLNHWGDEIILPTIHSLIDKFIAKGKLDFVNEFTKVYPFEIIYRQLALPERDIATFHKLATSLIQTYGDLIEYGKEASRKLGIYFKELIDIRREYPGTDLVSHLAATEIDGEYLPEEIMISFFRQLMAAAADTTYRATGAMLIGLVSNPDQLAAVRADRSLVAAAVEEALRWNGPNTFSPRMVMRDVEVGGLAVPEGSIIYYSQIAANRDPSIFPEPDKFDIHRPRERNMAFGYGPHVCLGQHLARIEMSHALNAILDRLGNLRFDPDKPVARILGIGFRTPRDIHLLFDPVV